MPLSPSLLLRTECGLGARGDAADVEAAERCLVADVDELSDRAARSLDRADRLVAARSPGEPPAGPGRTGSDRARRRTGRRPDRRTDAWSASAMSSRRCRGRRAAAPPARRRRERAAGRRALRAVAALPRATSGGAAPVGPGEERGEDAAQLARLDQHRLEVEAAERAKQLGAAVLVHAAPLGGLRARQLDVARLARSPDRRTGRRSRRCRGSSAPRRDPGRRRGRRPSGGRAPSSQSARGGAARKSETTKTNVPAGTSRRCRISSLEPALERVRRRAERPLGLELVERRWLAARRLPQRLARRPWSR